MEQKIKASIIIRAYNAEATLPHAVKSALAQDFPRERYEIIIIDDGSTDGTAITADSFKNTCRIIHQPNQGAIAAANRGLSEARGDYVVYLDSDDQFEPNLLSALVPILEEDSTITFAYPDYWEKKHDAVDRVSPSSVFETVFGGIVFRRSALIEEKGLRPLIFAEYDLFLRTLGRWKFTHYKEQPLYVYIRRPGSITMDESFVKNALNELQHLHPDKISIIESIRSYH